MNCKDTTLSTADVARFLKRLSATFFDKKTGNLELGQALLELSIALNTNKNEKLSDVISKLKLGAEKSYSQTNRVGTETLSSEKIESILSDDNTKKVDLIELGFKRFGIPKSGLERLNRMQIIEKIRATLRHQDSLKIISQEARRSGFTHNS